MLSTSVSGMIFGGSDIPGYAGVPTQSLFVISYQSAMFYPFFRAHCSIDNTEREPWLQSQEVQDVIRETVFLRYSLIHYLYSTFYQASSQGTPIMRPMFVAFPKTESMFGLASQFMFGDDIFVSPKLDSSYKVTTTLPPTESWYNYNTQMLETRSGTFSETYPVMDIPMWVRAGSILPILNHSR